MQAKAELLSPTLNSSLKYIEITRKHSGPT